LPNIKGTSGSDSIDVTDDVGTLNGTPQGTRINNVRAKGGADTISITDSTITGVVNSNGGQDVVTIQGSSIGTINLGGGADTLDFINSSASSISGGSGSDALNLPVGTVVTDETHGTFTTTLGGSYSLSSGSFILPTGQTVTYSAVESGVGIPCFTPGTMITTPKGPKPIEQLSVGDLVITQDHGLQAIRWIGEKKITGARLFAYPHLQPIRIKKDAFGVGKPNCDLLVSPQHRMVISNALGELLYGSKNCLLCAKSLLDHPSIEVAKIPTTIYIHIMFDQHQIIYANGCATESFHPGSYILEAMETAIQDEIYEIFPELKDSVAAKAYGPSALPSLSINDGIAFMEQITMH